MKTFLNYLPLLAIAGLFALGSPEKQPAVVESVASAPSPACDCNPCKCMVCDCKSCGSKPLPAAELSTKDTPKSITHDAMFTKQISGTKDADVAPTITPAEAKAVEQVAFTQPQVLPVKPPPQPQVLPVKPKAAPVVAGHYEYRQQCNGRSCQVVRVWVPHQPAKQAAPIVYQQPVQYYQQPRGWFRGRSCGPGGCR
jgi:hypothetical protein